MHTMRRGSPAAAPGVPERARESSQGRASDTPAARRKRRRSSFMGTSLQGGHCSGARARASFCWSRLGNLETDLLADHVRQGLQDLVVLQQEGLDAGEAFGVNAVGLIDTAVGLIDAAVRFSD